MTKYVGLENKAAYCVRKQTVYSLNFYRNISAEIYENPHLKIMLLILHSLWKNERDWWKPGMVKPNTNALRYANIARAVGDRSFTQCVCVCVSISTHAVLPFLFLYCLFIKILTNIMREKIMAWAKHIYLNWIM